MTRRSKKKPLILAVGGWGRPIKDPALLVKTCAETLKREPEYKVRIIGSGVEVLERLISPLPPEIRSRIEVAGAVPHSQLFHHYQEARIVINTSWAEGAPNVLAEGLCCGCSVVGHALIASLHFFASTASGTLSCDRSPRNYLDALRAEIDAWRLGWRDPAAISKIWLDRAPASQVAKQILFLASANSGTH